MSGAALALAMTGGGLALAQVAMPSGGQVVAGQATISSASAGAPMVVTQSSGKAIIDWRDFSIGAGGAMRFDNGSGATLNRVTGGGVSNLDGQLSASGSVYLINPNGVIIGKTGVVDVGGGFIASTLDVDNSQFMAGGDLTFTGDSLASVTNLGRIGALGGDVALLAMTVRNEGSLTAVNGAVGLIAGRSILMRDAAQNGGKFLVQVGSAGDSATNGGAIAAATAELRTEGGSVYALAGNTLGVIRATGVSAQDGKVYLTAGQGGSVTVQGGLIAAAKASGDGGAITLTGGTVTVASGALLDASATGVQGEGGAILALADMAGGALSFQGQASARGGALSGDGGFIETSGARVDFTGGRFDATAALGATGTWLVDPYNLTIDSAAAATINSNLGLVNVTLQTTGSGTSGPGAASIGDGDIIINADLHWSSASVLTLDAYHAITVNADIAASGSGGVILTTNDGGNGGDLTFAAGKSLSFTGGAGSLTINGGAYALLHSWSDVMNADSTGLNALAQSVNASGSPLTSAVFATYSGVFEGLGHTIDGLTLTGLAAGDLGMFGTLSGTARDLGLTNASLTGYSSGGGGCCMWGPSSTQGVFAGTLDSAGLLQNVYSTGTVSVDSGDTGGLVGTSQGAVINAWSSVNLTSTGDANVGGLLGYNGGTLSLSHATGSASNSLSSGYAGGAVATNYGTISQVYATGAVQGGTLAGGLVGSGAGQVSDSYATGAVTGGYYAGGLYGIAQSATLTDVYATGSVTSRNAYDAGGLVGYAEHTSITNAYATGLVTSGSNSVGGLLGTDFLSQNTIINGYYDAQTTGMSDSGKGVGLTTAQLQGTLPSGFGANWGTGSGLYPYLTAFGTITSDQVVSGLAYNGDGSLVTLGGTVGVYSTGTLLSGAAASIGSNGYYYVTLPLGTVTSGAAVGATLTLTGASTVSGATYTDAPTFVDADISGLDVTAGQFLIDTVIGSYGGLPAAMAATFGNTLAGSLNTGLDLATLKIRAQGAFTVDGMISRSGAILVQAGGDLTLDGSGGVSSTATGDAIVLAANGSLINTSSAGSNAVSAVNGRWLIYTQATGDAASAATANLYRGLAAANYYGDAYDFKTGIFAGSVNAGNRLVTGYQPTLLIAADDLTVVYNGAAQATTYSVTGYLTADDQATDALTGTAGGLISASKDVGDYGVTPNGLSSDQNYALTYASGSLHITPATLVASLTGSTSKTYDGLTGAVLTGANYSLSGAALNDDVTLNDPTSGLYDDKNAGAAKTVTAAGLVLSGADAGNYTVNGSASGAIGEITPATLTASLTGSTSKTYDGLTTAVLTGANYSLSGAVLNDDVALNTPASGLYGDDNAGSSKTVTASGLVLSGTDAGNYTVNGSTSGAIGSITPAALVALLTGTTTKTYDGLTGAVLTSSNYALSGAVLNDDVALNDPTSGLYGDKNAGAAKTITASGLMLSGADAGNYTVNGSASGAIGEITPATLTASLTGSTSKTYDGLTTAVLTGANYSLSGAVLNDDVTLYSLLAGLYGDKNVGAAKTVTAAGLALTGADAGNYSFNGSASGAIGVITPATLVASLTGATTKTYDGLTTAVLTGANYSLSGAVLNDDVALNTPASGLYGDDNAGSSKAVTASGLALSGTDAGNYTVNGSTSGAIGSITPAALVALLTGTTTKTYDGLTGAVLTSSNYALSGAVLNDDVALNDPTSGLYGDKNVGAAKTITASGLVLSGADAGNYTVNGSASGAIGEITPAALVASLTGTATKIYDGLTTAVLTSSNYALAGAVLNDVVIINHPTAGLYADKTAGAAKNITAFGLTVSGADAGNYVLASTTASAAIGEITAKMITAGLSGLVGKTYDGGVVAALGGNLGLTGVVGDDAIAVAATGAAYEDRNAAAGKLVTASGLTLSGGDAGNYVLASATTSASIGVISAKTLTAGLSGSISKTYDGVATATLDGNLDLSGLIDDDQVEVATAGATYDDKNAATGKQVTASGLTLSGADHGNYVLASTTASGTIGVITAKTVTAGLTGSVSKTYDGATTATLDGNLGLIGLVWGDTVTVASTVAAYADKNVGIGKTVTVNGLSLGGIDAGNYQLASATVSASVGVIAAKSLAVVADDKAKAANDADPALTYVATGLVSGDGLAGTLTRVLGETVGTYAITRGTLSAGDNYAVNYTPALLTINLAVAPVAPAVPPVVTPTIPPVEALIIPYIPAEGGGAAASGGSSSSRASGQTVPGNSVGFQLAVQDQTQTPSPQQDADVGPDACAAGEACNAAPYAQGGSTSGAIHFQGFVR